MAKMTGARVERWQKKLDKSLALILEVQEDLGDAKLATKDDGVYRAIVDLGKELVPAMQKLDELTSPEIGLSPIERVRRMVIEAANKRKEAKLRKQSEAKS